MGICFASHLGRLRTYTFESFETSSEGITQDDISARRTKPDIKEHKRRSQSQGHIDINIIDDPTNPWNSHWMSTLTLPTSTSNVANDISIKIDDKSKPQHSQFLPIRRTGSPVSSEGHHRVAPSAWTSPRKGSGRTYDSGDGSSTNSTRTRKTSIGGSTTRFVNLTKTLRMGPSITVERKAGRGGGVWVRNSNESSTP
jgi:hypothetical protein